MSVTTYYMNALKENGELQTSKNVAGHIAMILKRDGIPYNADLVRNEISYTWDVLIKLK